MVYSATLPKSGTYEVGFWYSANTRRADNVPVDITHAGGTVRIRVNQRINGSQWYSLGQFGFDASQAARVRIGNEGTSGFVVADALRFNFVPSPVTKAGTLAGSPNFLTVPVPAVEIQVARIAHVDGAVEVSWSTVSGCLNELEEATDLHGEWTAVASVAGHGDTAVVLRHNRSNSPRFWRVKRRFLSTPPSVSATSQPVFLPAN